MQLLDGIRAERAKRALKRYGADSYAMAKECFRTYDPKGGAKLDQGWFSSKYHERVWRILETASVDGDQIEELDLFKSKQTFASWLACGGFPAAMMLLRPGFRVGAQSRKDEMSWDLRDRVAHIYRHLRGPLEGALVEGRDWQVIDNKLELVTALGERVESSFTALPQGADQWRGWAFSLGILDEIAYHRNAMQVHEAAASACEGGGLLVLLSTPKYETHFNREVARQIKEYERWARQRRVAEATA